MRVEILISMLLLRLALACFPSGQAEAPDLITTTTVAPTTAEPTTTTEMMTTTTMATTTTSKCTLSGFDIYFTLPPVGTIIRVNQEHVVMTAEALRVLGDHFVDRFKIGDGPDEARFGAVVSNTDPEKVDRFRLGTIIDKRLLKEALREEVHEVQEMQNGIAKVAHDIILPEFRNKRHKNRKLYRIVFAVHDNYHDDPIYKHQDVNKQAKEIGMKTFVIAASRSGPKDIAMITGEQADNVFTVGKIENLEKSKELDRIYDRIISEQTCT